MKNPCHASLVNTLACFALVVLAATPSLRAQEAITYIHAGHLVNVTSGTLLQDQAIVIRGERLQKVGPRAAIPRPSGARFIDLSQATVLPGLIDAHVHLTTSAEKHGYSSLQWSSIRRALYGTKAARLTLRAGFTTVRNVGAGAFADVALRDAIHDGDVDGPRMVASGPAIGMTGGHCDSNLLPRDMQSPAGGVADGPWAVRNKVRENLKYGAQVIKFCATGGVLSKGTAIGARQYTEEEMAALVDEAHTLGLKVAAHAHGTDGIKAAIAAGVDSIEHASLLDDETIALALKHKTFLVMDVYVSDFILQEGESAGILPESLDKERKVGKQQRESFRRALDAGVKIAYGTDAGVYPHGTNGLQFAYMVEHGMTPMQAIQAATLQAAELLGWSDRVGALEPQLFADLIAVAGNPLEDIRLLEKVDFVMKGGQIYLDQLSTR